MMQEEQVLGAVKKLNELTSKRKEIESELDLYAGPSSMGRYEASLKMDKLIDAIVQSSYLFSMDKVRVNPKTDNEYPMTVYYFLGREIVEKSKYREHSSLNRVSFEAVEELEKLSDEEKLDKVIGSDKFRIELLKSEIEGEEQNKKEVDEKLAKLCAERNETPWYDFARKKSLDLSIKYCKEEIEKIDHCIASKKEEINILESKLNSKEYIDNVLKKINKTIEYLKLYVQIQEEYFRDDAKSRESNRMMYKAKNDELEKVRKEEKELIAALAKESNCVKALVKISKDRSLDKETREMASKIVKFIAGQVEEKNNKR